MSLDSILTGMELNGIFLPAKMECLFHSCRNGGVIPFWLEWNEVIPFLQEWNEVIPFLQEWIKHSIPAGMEWPLHYCKNGMTPFHSSQNEMTTPFLQEWDEYSILAGRKLPLNSILYFTEIYNPFLGTAKAHAHVRRFFCPPICP